ncbi:MAG: hypothetical protein NVS2B12_36360 [Ktedonobacteraceae bacterium]
MGLEAYLNQQLDPASIDDVIAEQRLGSYLTLNMSPGELLHANIDAQVAVDELDTMSLLRALYSKRQLYEVMVNFWSEHFSIWHQKSLCPYLKTFDDRDVIRHHALHTFPALLHASAKSPAMLDYLDNATSNKDYPNENYARELLELHTLGVGHYTEHDVKEVARCFTGWTMVYDDNNQQGSFIFQPDLHDDGSKTVLGCTFAPGGGIKDGEGVLDLLAAHPATAHHVCQKLCRRFVSDDPPAALIQKLAQQFLATHGDIKALLLSLFNSHEFLTAPPKFKRPYEYLLSLYRALDVRMSTAEGLSLLSQLDVLGHRPFNHPSPEGYSDHSSRWLGSLLPRWNTALEIAYGKSYATHLDLFALAERSGVKARSGDIINYYAQHLLGRSLNAEENKVLQTFVAKAQDNVQPDPHTSDGRDVLIDCIALMIVSPAYQYR